MPSEIGVSSRTSGASASHHEENRLTIGVERFRRIASRFLRGEHCECAFDAKERADEPERDLRTLWVGGEGLEKVPAAVHVIPSAG
jgi:hypothetical protein